MTNLAQRAADELNVDRASQLVADFDNDRPDMQTTMRLIAKNDALQARVDELLNDLTVTVHELNDLQKRRSEPMPEPVPDYIKRKVCEEVHNTCPTSLGPPAFFKIPNAYTIARLIWERGGVEEVDPAEALAREALKAWHEDGTVDSLISSSPSGFAAVVAVIKRGMELAKEIG